GTAAAGGRTAVGRRTEAADRPPAADRTAAAGGRTAADRTRAAADRTAAAADRTAAERRTGRRRGRAAGTGPVAGTRLRRVAWSAPRACRRKAHANRYAQVPTTVSGVTDVLTRLAAAPGLYRGRGDGPEGGPFVA